METGGQSKVVAFRVDASISIGVGHVMRCLTLANMLREYGVKSCFICRAHPAHMERQIEAAGHQVYLLPLVNENNAVNVNLGHEIYTDWLGATVEEDVSQTTQCLLESNPVWLVVDHFAIDEAWEQVVKKGTDLKIMVIDGLANRKHECDLLLDQTFSIQAEARWEDLVPTGCKLFVGPRYALLRPEFIEARKNLRQRDGRVRRILVAFGGVDEPNATVKVLDALAGLTARDISLDVVVGSDNPHKAGILERYNTVKKIHIHVDPDNIPELMASADLAVGGGGTMTWERCLLQLPSLIISIAENQVDSSKALDSISAAVYLGDLGSLSGETIAKSVNELMLDEQKLFKMYEATAMLMSGGNSSLPKYLMKDKK